MLTKVTLEEIDNYLREQYAIRPNVMELIEAEGDLTVIDGLYLKSKEPKEEHGLTVTLYASEASSYVLARCENEHFRIAINRQSIYIEEPFHLHYLGDLIDTASLVMKQYDDERPFEGEPDIWKECRLRGDDAVDYNGSYLLTLADCINMYFTLKMIPEQTYCISAYYQMEVDNDSFPGPNVYMVKANSEDEALQIAAKKIWETDHKDDPEIDWEGFFQQCTFVNSENKETIKEKAEEEGWVLSICNVIYLPKPL